MRFVPKKIFLLIYFLILLGYFNVECLAETKKKSIISLFCIENFKDEMSKANIIYKEEIAKETCECYLKEFINTNSHQIAINKCKLETKKKFNL